MSTIKNHINTYADLTAYNNDLNKDFPNISYIQGTDEVKWVKEDPTLIVAKYNVTSTSYNTSLLGISNSSLTKIDKMLVDDVELSNPVKSYRFSTTGEHIVKYKLVDTTSTIIDMFYNLQILTNIKLPDTLTKINGGFCQGSVNLTSITIPSTVTSIGGYAFYGCSGLTSVTVEATTPPTLGNVDVFSSTNNCPIYVPTESVDTYKAAANWVTYASRIQAIPTT